MKSKKVILDTNFWISFLISKDFSFFDDFVGSNKLKLVFSRELMNEFIEVSQRAKFKKYFSKSDLERASATSSATTFATSSAEASEVKESFGGQSFGGQG